MKEAKEIEIELALAKGRHEIEEQKKADKADDKAIEDAKVKAEADLKAKQE